MISEALMVTGIQSILGLLLMGALLYSVFSSLDLDDNSLRVRLLLGAAFGAADLAMALNSIVIDNVVVVNATAGLVIFSGYLGGVASGGITLVITLLARATHPLEMMPIGVSVYTSYLLAGLVLRRIKPIKRWPELPDGILVYALLAFVAAQTIGALLARVSGFLPEGRSIGPYLPIFYGLGALSVAATWIVIRKAWSMAAIVWQNANYQRETELIYETCGIGGFRYDGKRQEANYSKSFLKLYQISAAEVYTPGQLAARFTHPDDLPAFSEFIKRAVTSDMPFGSYHFRALPPDGSTRHMRLVFKAQKDPKDGSRSLTGLHIDVSDIVNAQQATLLAGEQITAMAENLPGVVTMTIWEDGAPQKLAYVSPKSRDLWNISPEQFMADPWAFSRLQEPDQRRRVVDAVRQSMETGQSASTRLRLTTMDGRKLWSDYHVQTVPQGKDVYHAYAVFLDASRDMDAQEQLRKQAELTFRAQKNESIGQLTGGIAHDFNNILAVIQGYLELLRDDATDPKQISMIDASIAASRRGAGLTSSLLAFASRSNLSARVLDLNEVVARANGWMRRAIPSSIDVTIEKGKDLWPVNLDETALESALLNLIINARDAMGGKGKLSISTENVELDAPLVDDRGEEVVSGRYAVISVSDTGSGIPKDIMSRIFDPFFTTKPVGKGSGVGLSMVLGFANQSDGKVLVFSELGQGTTFKLYFKAAAEDVTLEAEPKVANPSKSPSAARLLLVEDDIVVQSVLEAILRKAGYTITTASSGDEALDLVLRSGEFDLMVTDIVMPGKLQGGELAAAVRNLNPDLPVVFLSGNSVDDELHDKFDGPNDVFFLKPAPRDALLAEIARLLDQARTE